VWPQPSPASGHSAKVASVPSHSGPDMAMGIRLNMLSPRSRCTKLPVVRCTAFVAVAPKMDAVPDKRIVVTKLKVLEAVQLCNAQCGFWITPSGSE